MISFVSNIRNFIIVLGVYLVTGVLGMPQQSIAASPDSATKPDQFIQALADKAISVLSDQRGTLNDREQKFHAILRDDFAMKKIGRFVAGKYWRPMSIEQKQQYQKLFEEWILKTYSIRFGGYSGEMVNVLKTIQAGATDVFVLTRIDSAKRRSLKVDWRVRRIDGKFKIIDVVVEGVSMLVTQKAEFGAIIRQRGIDGLIAVLRSQLEQLAATKPS
ncbi:MAG: putative phospholipid-binding protein MlaC [Alphaproteobacteria bacterium MarineAlpha4_Bin2]|nr:MAG: putative phospholipid-binding protein MlaC [Alphaproteobacteria bacterium MarineAlpha4_Bin2]|tara:strand:- start:41 stop:691 length:651 start_codon:yes stop_codon:yes gene_type:complete